MTMNNVTKMVGDKVVSRTRLLGGQKFERYTYAVYEPSSLFGIHSTVTTFEGLSGVYGQVGTRDIPAEVAALKGGTAERILACDAHRKAQYAEAHALIRAAFPETANATESYAGELTVTIVFEAVL